MRTRRAPVTRRFFITTGGTGFAALLAGCGNLIGPPPSPPIYVLEPRLPGAMQGAPVMWQLSIALPRAQASLDTMRIALRKMPSMLDYYADAAWTDRLPLVMQDLLVESFERSGRIAGVARDTSGIAASYRLDTELREFEAHYDQADAAPRIVVAPRGEACRAPGAQHHRELGVTEDAQSARNDLDSVISAFNQAGGAALQRIVEWTFKELPVG